MFKKQHLALAIAATLAAGSAQAALETSVVLKNETARFIKDGIRTGEATSSTDTTGAGKETFKFENTAKIFLNDELDNGMSWHGELNIVRDTKAIDGYDGHETNTQKDWLRELYVDTTAGDWDLRLGKQQVVWGTADGIKLLDMINPTDWSEFNQNAPADARIPVWMVNAERYLDNGDNVQFIISQSERNKIAGMTASNGETRNQSYTFTGAADTSGTTAFVGEDAGHPFVMKGVDTITGKVNGFFNIGAAMGQVTETFSGASFTNPQSPAVAAAPPELTTVGAFTGLSAAAVAGITIGAGAFNGFGLLAACGGVAGTTGAGCLEAFTEMSNGNVTNLSDADGYNSSNPTSTWEYMSNATFATFNSFVNMNTKYERKEQSNTDVNFGTRYRTNFDNGLNLSLNYAYAYNPNPVVNIHWENSSGEQLYLREFTATAGAASGTVLQLQNAAGTVGYGAITDYNNAVGDASGDLYGGNGPVDITSASVATLVFEEKLEQNHNIGTAFDYAIDGDNPVIVRGEFLYQKDVSTPIIDRNKLAIGNLTSALTTQKSDFFKYVLGAETTVATDMLVSGQFIQWRNLDYVNTGVDSSGNACTTANCGRYTGDMASMHLSNGLQKDEENKNFYSLFLSKPFGDSGEGRWNNIFIYEENGGKWNRFDVEYGFDDQLIGTFEVNKYFGDENTMFGQFENASNVQVGIKYLLQ